MPKSIRYTARLVVLVALAATLAMWHALASPRHSPYWSALSDLVAAPAFGAAGIAAANAAGITTTAVLLLAGLRRCGIPVPLSALGSATASLAAAAAVAGAAGYLAGRLLIGAPSIVVGTAGGLVVLGAFVALARMMGVLPGVR